MNLRAITINSSAVLLALMLFMSPGLIILQNSYETKKELLEKANKVCSLIKNDSYCDARDLYKQLRSSIVESDRDRLNSIICSTLKSEIESLRSHFLREDISSDVAASIEGLKLFNNEITDLVISEVDQVTNLYIYKNISYDELQNFYRSIIRFAIESNIIDNYKSITEKISKSRNSISIAGQFLSDKDYIRALDEYKKISPEDIESYKIAQENIKKCLDEMYIHNLNKAEELKKSYMYEEACEILEKISVHYPGDHYINEKLQEFKQLKNSLVIYKGPIQHLFFHPLIAYPELAFDNDTKSKGYNDWFITVKEFHRFLEAIYKNNFILVDINCMYETKEINGKEILLKRELFLPKDKKPFILSIDDVNYYDYMIRNGNIHKLILDSKGDIATYSRTPSGEEVIAYDNEIIPILDDFVKKHPDFSFRGAKGILALTGYEGVLGYRTHDFNSQIFEREKSDALKVIKRLKETGWSFACHGFGHLDTSRIGYDSLVRDTTRWRKEVESLIGPTAVYIYPFGSSVQPSDIKFQFLKDSGFRVFCAVGNAEYTKFLPDCILTDRRHIDGIALQQQVYSLADLFDANEILDSARPPFNN